MPPGGWKTTSCLKWAILRLSVGKTWGRKARVDPAKGDAPASQAPHFKAALPLFLGLVWGTGCRVFGRRTWPAHDVPNCAKEVFTGGEDLSEASLAVWKSQPKGFMVHFYLQDFENMICPEGA